MEGTNPNLGQLFAELISLIYQWVDEDLVGMALPILVWFGVMFLTRRKGGLLFWISAIVSLSLMFTLFEIKGDTVGDTKSTLSNMLGAGGVMALIVYPIIDFFTGNYERIKSDIIFGVILIVASIIIGVVF